MAEQLEQSIPSTTNQPQPAVMVNMPTQPFVNSPAQLMYKKIIRGLSIAEVVLGSICIVIGIIIACIGRGYYYDFTIGEGIWCGIWIVIAGALGIPSARINSTRCLINCHMAFCIVGAVFSGVMFSIGIVSSLLARYGFRLFAFVVLDICSFASLVLLIVSACYTCCLVGCCQQMQGYGTYNGQVVYTQQAISTQGGGLIAQPAGYHFQGYHPMAPTVQMGYAQPAVSSAPNQIVPNPNEQNLKKQQEAFGSQGQSNLSPNAPPAYEPTLANQM